MDIPSFPECNHTLVESLFECSDHELLQRLQEEPDAGRYFTALFCRYSPVVYTLIRHSARSTVQSEYLFALTWRHILSEVSSLKLPDDNPEEFSLQAWLVNLTAACINQATLPEVEEIHYSLHQAPPPLWCYVTRALDRLPPLERLVLVMAQTFRWSSTRIAAYLQAEGQRMAPEQVDRQVATASQSLMTALPRDIQTIYFGQAQTAESEDMLGDLLDMSDIDTESADIPADISVDSSTR